MLGTNTRGVYGEEREMVRVPEGNLETIYVKDSKFDQSLQVGQGNCQQHSSLQRVQKKIKTEKYFEIKYLSSTQYKSDWQVTTFW